jgi:chemotaxis protein methyltransferase CheR
MSIDGFAEISGLVRARAGIVLTADKAYLLETRLAPLLPRYGMTTLGELGRRLRERPNHALERAVVESLTTHETSFFRDQKPFDHLATLLPKLAGLRPPGQKLRIWSAACSSGQEPYSIAMVVAEALAGRNRGVEILASDISAEVLARAKEGVFSQFEVQRGLPIRSLVKHFKQEEARWRISAELRGMVRFEERNLLGDLSAVGRFDTIFCRNVLIYFDTATKTRVLDGMAKQLQGDGVLYLGGAETVLGLTERLKPIAGERGAYAPALQQKAA